mgnify:CR=1 FL=1
MLYSAELDFTRVYFPGVEPEAATADWGDTPLTFVQYTSVLPDTETVRLPSPSLPIHRLGKLYDSVTSRSQR